MIITEDMIFDTKTKRMRLTNDYVYNDLGTDLANALIDDFDTNLSTIADRTLKRTSDQLYNFIRANCVKLRNANAYYTACYLIATNADWYEAFKDALSEQLVFFSQGGDLSATSGVNVDRGTRVDKSIRDTISDSAIQIMESMGMFHTVIRDIPAVEEW